MRVFNGILHWQDKSHERGWLSYPRELDGFRWAQSNWTFTQIVCELFVRIVCTRFGNVLQSLNRRWCLDELAVIDRNCRNLSSKSLRLVRGSVRNPQKGGV